MSRKAAGGVARRAQFVPVVGILLVVRQLGNQLKIEFFELSLQSLPRPRFESGEKLNQVFLTSQLKSLVQAVVHVELRPIIDSIVSVLKSAESHGFGFYATSFKVYQDILFLVGGGGKSKVKANAEVLHVGRFDANAWS